MVIKGNTRLKRGMRGLIDGLDKATKGIRVSGYHESFVFISVGIRVIQCIQSLVE